VLALAALYGAIAWSAPGPAVENGALMLDGRRLVVRGAGYAHVPETPCLLARDLPLIASMGANTVRMAAPEPAADRYFLSILASTRLHWLADFPLQEPPANRERILAEFRAYVERFRGRAKILAFVFGTRQFAGPREEFYALFADARRILRETRTHALLTTAVADPEEMSREVPGLDFWTWEAHGPALPDPPAWRTRPVLLGSFGVSDGDPAAAAAGFASAIECRHLLGGIWSRAAGGAPGLDTVLPRAAYYKLAALWGGTYPAGWAEPEPPELEQVENETAASAGSVVRIAGARLMAVAAPYADTAWPFSLGGACVCVDGVPARIGYVSPSSLTVQIPAGLEPGERNLRFYRAGMGSNVLPLRIRLSADTSPGPILEVE
jgi:hypothetical protein